MRAAAVAECRRPIDDITALDVTPPAALTDLLTARDALAAVGADTEETITGLVKKVLTGRLTRYRVG